MKTLVLASPHERGDEVKLAQRKLATAGFYSGPEDAEFGPLTMQACRRAHFWLGFAGELEYAPTYGDKLDAVLDRFNAGQDLPAPNKANRAKRVAAAKRKTSTLGEKALAKLITQIGLTEQPRNSNHQKFGVWYGYDHVAWCAETATWAYVVGAGSKALAKGKRYAYVPYIVHDAGAGVNNLSITRDPKPGDLVPFDWEQNGVADHVGLFEKWVDRKNGYFQTVEGNTSPDDSGSQSNGGGVFRRGERPGHGDTRRVANVARYHGIPAFVRVGK